MYACWDSSVGDGTAARDARRAGCLLQVVQRMLKDGAEIEVRGSISCTGHSTLNPQTLSPEPSNPQPSTLKTQSSTLIPHPPQPSLPSRPPILNSNPRMHPQRSKLNAEPLDLHRRSQDATKCSPNALKRRLKRRLKRQTAPTLLLERLIRKRRSQRPRKMARRKRRTRTAKVKSEREAKSEQEDARTEGTSDTE